MPLSPNRIKTENRLSLLRGIALLPMVLYPWVFMAGLDTIGGGRITQNISEVVGAAAILLAFIYPVTLLVCLRYNRQRSFRIAAIPLWHLGLVVALDVLAVFLDR